MDPFYHIPSPVLLTIVKLCPDLPSLGNLIHASPVVSSLFDELPAEITDAVLASPALPQTTQYLVRSIIMIECYNYLPANPAYFLDTVHHTSGYWLPLSKSMPACGLRRVLAMASQIQTLGDSCIRELIARCMALEPSHLSLDSKGEWFDNDIQITCQPGKRYQQEDVGDPSWVEEQRVNIALWRLQLLFSLKKAAPRLDWSKDDLRDLRNTSLDELWCRLPQDQLESVKCVYEYLQYTAQQNLPHSSSAKTSGSLNELPNIGTDARRTWQSKEPQDDRSGRVWRQSTRDLEAQSPGYMIFSYTLSHCRIGGHPMESFDIFRRLGFSIWDHKRMTALGFLSTPGSILPRSEGMDLSVVNLRFTWHSISPRFRAAEQPTGRKTKGKYTAGRPKLATKVPWKAPS